MITILVIVVGGIGFAVSVLMFGGPPMTTGLTLADGKVTLVVDRAGPVRIGAYIVELADDGLALVDTGMDPAAAAILAALADRGASAADIRAVLLTHAHGDHAGGISAFPSADIYAMASDARMLRDEGLTVKALADGERITIGGTAIDAYAMPGHTAGSAAYLVHGVLFLGDAAAAASESSLESNDVAFTDNSAQNRESLHALANRIGERREDVQFLAFGHQGPMPGPGPLLDWSSADRIDGLP